MPNIRKALLPFTISNAAKLPFYSKFWSRVDTDSVQSLADLHLLPTLTKSEYRRSFMFEPASVSKADYVTHTTGTTGEVTWRHRSALEASVIGSLFQQRKESDNDELSLVIRYNRHGMAMPVPGRARSIPISVTDAIELKQCLEMLTATYYMGGRTLRPTILAGGGQDLALLAQSCLESQVPREKLAIRTIYLGGFVDTGLRRFIRRCFDNADVIEKFSMAEIFGGATRRWPDESFTLDPYVVGEVVDEQGNPLGIGETGELVLTELFPFVQIQPLIRYRTGDIVQLIEQSEEITKFQWWGRRHQCALGGEEGLQRWILGYRPLADWLSQQPVVARQAYRSYLPLTSSDLGAPCVAVSIVAESVLRVEIGVRVNPWWETRTIQALMEGLWDLINSTIQRPPEWLYIQLAFRHVPGFIDDFTALPDSRDLVFTPTRPSDLAPNSTWAETVDM